MTKLNSSNISVYDIWLPVNKMTWTVSLKLRYRQNEEYWSKSHGKDQGHKVMVQVNCSLSPSLPYLSSLSYLYAIQFLLNELNVKHRQTDGRKEYRHIYVPAIYLVHVHVLYRQQTY